MHARSIPAPQAQSVPLLAGIDLARNTFQVCMSPAPGQAVRNRGCSRAQFMQLLSTLPAGTVIAFEACGSCHYWARRCTMLGLMPRIIPASVIHSLNQASKDDRSDAWTITGSPGGLPSRVYWQAARLLTAHLPLGGLQGVRA